MSSKKYKLSIFCSVFNGQEFINSYLSHITRQTMFGDCELIMVNPGDMESSVVINDYASSNKNIRHISVDKDPGMYGCWNIAVNNSSGEYMNNANLDDIKKDDSLEVHAKHLDQNQDIDLFYSDSLITKTPNMSFEYYLRSCKYRYNFPEFSISALIDCNPPHQSPVYRRSMHDKFGLFNTRYKFCADGEFWLRCATNGVNMKKIDEILGAYYMNPKGVSTSIETDFEKTKEEAAMRDSYKEYGSIHNGNVRRICLNNDFINIS